VQSRRVTSKYVLNADFTAEQLSKEDEAAATADEVEVRREDQDKINKFSRLHQKEISLEDDLKTKNVCRVLRLAYPFHHANS